LDRVRDHHADGTGHTSFVDDGNRTSFASVGVWNECGKKGCAGGRSTLDERPGWAAEAAVRKPKWTGLRVGMRFSRMMVREGMRSRAVMRGGTRGTPSDGGGQVEKGEASL